MWNITGSLLCGISHIKNNNPCQDVISSFQNEKVCCITLADGAGSYRYPLDGARISTSAICNMFANKSDLLFNISDAVLKTKIIHSIRTRLGMVATEKGVSKEEFSSTLLFIVSDGKEYICGHIGDGTIGIIFDDGTTELLSEGENGEFVNETYFTTTKNYQKHFTIYRNRIKGVKSFFLMSDGAASCLYNKSRKTFAPAISKFSQWLDFYPIEVVNKAISDSMRELFPEYTTDDCSFILMQKKNI